MGVDDFVFFEKEKRERKKEGKSRGWGVGLGCVVGLDPLQLTGPNP